MENTKAVLRHELMGSIYNKLSTGTTLLMISEGVAFAASIITMQNPTIIDSCGALLVASSIGYLVVDALKENAIKSIRNLYQEFIRNYNELNRTFGLQNPAELQAMFRWLLIRGYLSKDKTYQSNRNKIRDYLSIMGANILMGQGVCRHATPLFTDILNDYGIEAFTLSGMDEDYDININNMYELERIVLEIVKETLNNSMLKEADVQEIESFLNQKRKEIEQDRIDAILSYKKVQKNNREIESNHVISLAVSNGEAYYLGYTWREIFEYDSVSKLLYSDISTFQINLERSMRYNDEGRMQRLQEFLKSPYPCASREEILKLMEATEKICEQNIDIFEQFYRENQELYEEVSMRLRKL